jgi:hypothetical protein
VQNCAAFFPSFNSIWHRVLEYTITSRTFYRMRSLRCDSGKGQDRLERVPLCDIPFLDPAAKQCQFRCKMAWIIIINDDLYYYALPAKIECRLGSMMEVAMIKWINLNGSCAHVMSLYFLPFLSTRVIGGNALGFSTLAWGANKLLTRRRRSFCCMWCHIRFYLRIKLGTMVDVELPSTTIDEMHCLASVIAGRQWWCGSVRVS